MHVFLFFNNDYNLGIFLKRFLVILNKKFNLITLKNIKFIKQITLFYYYNIKLSKKIYE